MAIAYLECRNIQAHKGNDNRITMPETGVVRLKGNNNDGKSVMPKAFSSSIKMDLGDPDVRKALITRGHEYGELEVCKTNGDTMLVHISKEASQTYYEFKFGEDEPIRRYLSNKGIDQLIALFGFHYNKNRDISLNIYSTYDPLLMVTTSGVTNLDLIQSAIKNSKAEVALTNLEEVRKNVKTTVKEIELHRETAIRTMSTLQEFDMEKEKLIIAIGSDLLRDLKNVKAPPMLPTFTDDSFLEDLIYLTPMSDIDKMLNEMILPEEDLITDLEVLYSIGKLADIKSEMHELIEIEDAIAKNICPTCLRPHITKEDIACQIS